MCLSKITSHRPRPASGTGYKVLVSGYTTPTQKVALRPGKWMTAHYEHYVDDAWTTRATGFHIYLYKKDALPLQEAVKGHIYKVSYREAVCTGTGDGGWNYGARVVVAKEIKVMPLRRTRTKLAK